MKFGEKLTEQRKKADISRTNLAKALNVSRQTIVNYESGASHPQDRAMYFKLAEFFKVNPNYFLTEDEEFLTKAAESYGKKGRDKASLLLDEAAALFAGGELSETDKIAFIHNMQAMFLESMEEAKKYTPKKFRSKA